MSQDLFGAVAAGAADRPSARSRKSTVVIASAAAHALAICVVSAMQLGYVDRWPTPRQVLAFYEEPRLVRPADIPLPPTRPPSAASDLRRPVTDIPSVTSVPSPAAPLTAPTGITPDSSLESPPTAKPDGPGAENATRGTPADVTRERPPVPQAPTPIRLHSGIRAPEKTVHVAPLYPPLARTSRVQGLVIIEATIDVRGSVESARVLRSVALLDQAALDAVRQWKYSPTLLNGVAVPIVMTVTVNFMLD